MSIPWLPQNPGIGTTAELTAAELALIQSLSALGDPNADRILFWDDSAGAYAFLTVGSGLSISTTTITATAGIDGAGTTDELAYWSDGDTLSALAVATYPSKAEIAHVKGVTSAIQTQLNNKQPLDADLTSIAALTTTAYGRGLLELADEAALEATIDTLANLTSIQGRTVTLADAGANAIFGWDDTASAYENLTQAEARTVLGLGTAAYVATDLSDLNEATIEGAIDTLANLTSIQGRTVTLSDAGFDVLAGWDDSGSAYKNFLLADILSEASPASGDFILMYGAEGDLRKFDVANLPAGGVPTQITVANEATDTTCFPLFVTAATGDLAPKTVASFTLNSNTGALGITTIELGHASQNTLSASSGILSIEGVAIPTISSTDALSNKTLTAPKFADLGFIADANGNELFILDTVASAVNEITFANAATANNPKFSATGGDTNIGIDFQAKGTGTYRLLGTADQAAELRLYEDTTDGTNYTAFKVGTQTGDITYTLPTDDGDASQVLSTNGSGVLDWITPSSGGDMVVYLSCTNMIGTNAPIAANYNGGVVVRMTNNQDQTLAGQVKVPSGATSISGIKMFIDGNSGNGNLRLRFRTVHYNNDTSSTAETDITDSETAYAVNASTNPIQTITVPAGAFDGLTNIDADDLIGIQLYRNGANALDTFEDGLDVLGFLFTFA